MKNILQKVFKNRSTRVLVLLFIVLIALVTYSLLNSYFVQLDIHKEKVLSRLDAIAKTTASQINGDQFEKLINTYPKVDDINANEQNTTYQEINTLLKTIKSRNELNSELYTLTFDEKRNEFFFGVSSSEIPFYRHAYDHFPKELVEHYETGGKVGVYEDKNGYWLSAFAPIKNSNGIVVGVVQADSLFDEFISEARHSILVNIGFSLFLMLILVIFLIRSVRSILITEDKLTSDLIESKCCLEEQNRDIMDSIHYANKIQEAILTKQSNITKIFKESFILFKPRDIVSGDFYWFKQVGDFKVVASVDCTGHGVPGAFMSMIGSILLDEIIIKQQITDPNIILDKLHDKVVESLKQNAEDADSKDGMDIALCVIHEESKRLCYTGACRPLVYVRDNEVIQIKPDALPIGGIMYDRSGYSSHSIDLIEGDVFYIFSDGYPDQFGGEKNKKYMTPRFRRYLHSISSYPMSEQEQMLEDEFNRWKGDEEQVDDVLVIGFKV